MKRRQYRQVVQHRCRVILDCQGSYVILDQRHAVMSCCSSSALLIWHQTTWQIWYSFLKTTDGRKLAGCRSPFSSFDDMRVWDVAVLSGNRCSLLIGGKRFHSGSQTKLTELDLPYNYCHCMVFYISHETMLWWFRYSLRTQLLASWHYYYISILFAVSRSGNFQLKQLSTWTDDSNCAIDCQASIVIKK